MRVSFHAYGYLRYTSTLGEDGTILTLAEALTPRIRDLLPTFNILEEEVESVMVNGTKTRLDRRVHNKDRVDFYPRGWQKKLMSRAAAEKAPSEPREGGG